MSLDFHRNHFLLYNMAFWGFVFLSVVVAIVPAFQASHTPPTPGLQPPTPDEQRGRDLYVAEGCSYCHSQQVRPLLEDRPYGRPSAPGDFAYATPQLLGAHRNGPDLANIGNRQPDETWHLLHLFNPRIVVKQSVMPQFPWYFEVKDRPEPGDIIVPVQPPYAAPGKVVVATRDALALVAYLQSLKQPKLDLKMLGMTETAAPAPAAGADSAALGPQIFGTNCARCHQPEGTGLAGLAPPLRGNAVVTATDPTDHIRTVLFGQGGKIIDGKQFPGRMPAFHDVLSDEEIAAVINHERRSFGNNAPPTTAEAVRKERAK